MNQPTSPDSLGFLRFRDQVDLGSLGLCYNRHRSTITTARTDINGDSSIRIYRFQTNFGDRQFTVGITKEIISNQSNHSLTYPLSHQPLSLDLLLKEVPQGHGIGSELGDTLTQLLNGHGLLVEVEAESGLVVEVLALGDVQTGGTGGVELLGHGGGRVVQLLQQVGRDGQVVAASQLGDLASVAEGGTHDDGLVAVLLVVVVDGLDGLDTGVLLGGVVALVGVLVPVKDTTHEGGDQEGTGLGGGDGLDDREHQGQVAVDLVLRLQNVGGLDTLPGGGDLDQDAVLGDTLLLVQLETRGVSIS